MAWWKKDEPRVTPTPQPAATPPIPTPPQFRDKLHAAYRATCNPPLLAGVLNPVITTYSEMPKPQTAQQASDYFDACLQGLKWFSDTLPAHLHDTPQSNGIFKIIYPLRDVVAETQGHRIAFREEHKLAYVYLGLFLKDREKFSFLDWNITYPEESALKSYPPGISEKELKQHWKEALEDEENDHPYTKPFHRTPLYSHALQLLPSGTFTAPFDIPPPTRFSGTWIVAPPGRGKTNLLHHLVAQDRPHGTVILMDSKGDLINSYKGLPDSVLIDPATVAINPLQLGSSTRSIEFLEYIFSALLETGMTALQKTLFRSVLSLLLKVPNATLETFRQILTTGWKPFAEYMPLCDQPTQEFFTAKPAEFDAPTYKETKMQVLWRLRLILSNEYLRQIFTAPKSNIDFFKLLDSRKLIIIDNSKDVLGEDGSEFFGRFFIAILWMAAVSRSRLRPEDKVPVYCYLDEAHSVIKRDDKIATILDECRSQRIALTMAHQRIAQIVSPNVLDALGNCAIRIANSDDDAAALSPRFRTPPENLRQPVGTFALFVRDRTPSAVIASVTEFDLSKLSEKTHTLPPQPPREPPRPPEEPPEPSLYDLDWEATLSPKMAEQGGAKAIHGLTVRIVPGTKDRTRVRLKGKGAKKPDGTFGDAYITYSVVTRPDQPTLGYYDDETDAKPW